MPDPAPGRHPQDLGREPEQDGQPEPVRRAARPRSGRAATSTSRRPTAARSALIPDSTWSAVTGPDERDDRHERDRRERRERDVEAATDRDDVVRPEPDVDRRPAVEERVGEVEEVAAPGVELAVRQPVDHGRDPRRWRDRRGATLDGRRVMRPSVPPVGMSRMAGRVRPASTIRAAPPDQQRRDERDPEHDRIGDRRA